MSVQAEITVTLAEVGVSDDYRVELTTHERVMPLTWSEAEQLANELITAVEDARAMLREDFPVPDLSKDPHTFDVVPVCKDCSDGHHGACIGSAFVEVDSDVGVDEVECGWLEGRPSRARGCVMTATMSPTEISEAVRFGIHDSDVIAGMEEHADDEFKCVVIEVGRECENPATHALVCMHCNKQAAWACDVHAVKVRCSYQPVSHAPCGKTGLLRFMVRVVPL